MVKNVEKKENEVDIIVKEKGIEDLRGIEKREREKVIIEN